MLDVTTKYPYHKASYNDLLRRCYELEGEVFQLDRALQKAEEASNQYVTTMVQQADASDKMKLDLILSGLLRSPSELSALPARSES